MVRQPVRISLSDFIKTTMGSQFVIPVYQRSYTWSPDKETARFMNDVENLLKDRRSSHFLGIIIYMESQISTMFRQLQIVDGQQRVTTSFIFLLALKRIAEEKRNKNIAGMIDDYYLYNRHVAKEAALRLKPAVSNDDVYARLVYGNAKDLTQKEKESGVFRNYEFIRRRIRDLSQRYPLAEILDCLSRLDILEFPLSETDNAQQIFESINSTGAPLTSADLIRNYVLMNHTDDVQEHYYKFYWEPMESDYPDSRRLEEFFRFYLASKTFDLLSRKEVYEGFKKFWSNDPRDTEKKLQEINRYCRYYHDIYDGPAENKNVENALKDFRRSQSKLPAPFLMEMYSLFDDRKITDAQFAGLIRLVDSYLMRRALCGNDTSAISRYFPTLLRTVLDARSENRKTDIVSLTRAALITYNKGKAQAMPTDDQLRSQLCEINAYSLMCLRPVLDRIEHEGAHAAVDLSDLNIEHIMPQHPNKWWKTHAGCETDDEYTFYVNLIGNLTLCAEYDNSRMGNNDFNAKKKQLQKTLHIRMNTQILKKNHWNKNDILERCSQLADEIIRIYPYSGSDIEKPAIRNKKVVVLNSPTVSARAIIHSETDIEVLSGTTMKAYSHSEMKTMRQLYLDLCKRDILTEDENGRAQFERSRHFKSLNEAAQFLMHRGGDNSAAWVHEDGSTLSNPKKTIRYYRAKKGIRSTD
ncbi:MAG: DUF262 domain-containing HNH endonuclease family protein [Solobacterium sp.]|nr:DUF262 domain-containing HNH endonuclease family protein [Solobacterium sp.]